MKSSSGVILGLTLLAGVLAALPAARAEEAAKSCEVPDDLLASDSALPKVAEAVKSGHALNILVVGSRSSTIGNSEASAYPGRLQAMLKEKLPAITVNVSVELEPKKTAGEVAAGLVKLVEDKKPVLVIWQTGTADAMRSIDPDDFRTAVDGGVAALQNAGTDVVLMNLQYSPRTETMISTSPYLDNMRAAAQEHDVPLFDRFAIMRNWNEEGDFGVTRLHRRDDETRGIAQVAGFVERGLVALAHETAVAFDQRQLLGERAGKFARQFARGAAQRLHHGGDVRRRMIEPGKPRQRGIGGDDAVAQAREIARAAASDRQPRQSARHVGGRAQRGADFVAKRGIGNEGADGIEPPRDHGGVGQRRRQPLRQKARSGCGHGAVDGIEQRAAPFAGQCAGQFEVGTGGGIDRHGGAGGFA
jgi:hypothetical protein